MRVSTNFTLAELTKSQTALRLGIANMPHTPTIERLRLVCLNILEPVRKRFNIPFSPNSGYRSPQLNRIIGGAPSSQHVTGEAVDFEIPGISNYDLAVWIRDNLEFDQLILEAYTVGTPNSGWVHVSYKATGNRKEVLTASFLRGKPVYRKGLIK